MKNKIYVQLNANALPHYIVGGCIRPVCIIERRENDIQSVFNDFILLSTKKWSLQSDCSIEIVLTDLEYKSLIVLNSDYFIYDSIIPLSRITKIFFLTKDKKKSDDIIWNIGNGAGFVPDKWIFYEDKLESEVSIDEIAKVEANSNDINSLRQSYIKFNRLLGGFAFLKSALYDLSDLNLNYPVNYFASLGFYNEFLNKKSKDLGLTLPLNISSILSNENSISKYIGREVNLELLENVAKKEGIQLEMKFGDFPFDAVPNDTLLFKLGILYTYGKSKSKSVEDLIGSLFVKLEYNKREEVALLFGLNTGYERLRNYYKFSDRDLNIKFDFESKLDLYIVETIFQHSINHLKSNEFDFSTINNGSLSPIEVAPEDYISYNFFDTLFITKPKDNLELLEKIIDEVINSLLSWFPQGLFKLNTERLRNFFMLRVKNVFSKSIEQIKADERNKVNIEISEKSKLKKLKSAEVNNLKHIEVEKIGSKLILKENIIANETSDIVLPKVEEFVQSEKESVSSLDLIDSDNTTEFELTTNNQIDEISQIDFNSRADQLKCFNLKELEKQAKSYGIKLLKGEKEKEIIFKIVMFESKNAKFL